MKTDGRKAECKGAQPAKSSTDSASVSAVTYSSTHEVISPNAGACATMTSAIVESEADLEKADDSKIIRLTHQPLKRVATFLPIRERIFTKVICTWTGELADSAIRNAIMFKKSSQCLINTVYDDADSTVAAAKFEAQWFDLLLTIVELDMQTLSGFTALFLRLPCLSFANDRIYGRMKAGIDQICSINADSSTTFGCVIRDNSTPCMYHDRFKLCYTDLVQWGSNLPRLSVLFIPSALGIRNSKTKKEAEWPALKKLTNLRQIHFLDDYTTLIICDKTESLPDIELVTVKSHTKFEEKFSFRSKRKILNEIFPKALIMPRQFIIELYDIVLWKEAKSAQSFFNEEVVSKSDALRSMSGIRLNVKIKLPLQKITATCSEHTDQILMEFERFYSELLRSCNNVTIEVCVSDSSYSRDGRAWSTIRKLHRLCCASGGRLRVVLQFDVIYKITGKKKGGAVSESIKNMWYARTVRDNTLRENRRIKTFADAYYVDAVKQSNFTARKTFSAEYIVKERASRRKRCVSECESEAEFPHY